MTMLGILLLTMILQRFFSTTLPSRFPRGVSSTAHLTTKNSKAFKLVAFPEPVELLPKDKSFGNRTFARPVQFIKSVSLLEQAPVRDLPEVAFVGRSNVGVSSNPLYCCCCSVDGKKSNPCFC
ncbi:hypothetical protein CLU79DRAFT_65831 [Phycomyces nitens]|nr:hypothetical protein CLU79DRAFT_65831 [Phycomyces nitens]